MLGSFLAPIENPSDAAFIAEIATEGVANCTHSVRMVDGGFEVITETTYPCGGEQDESRVFVATDGTVTIREHVVLSAPSGGPPCA
jgi:hypothetical protein